MNLINKNSNLHATTTGGTGSVNIQTGSSGQTWAINPSYYDGTGPTWSTADVKHHQADRLNLIEVKLVRIENLLEELLREKLLLEKLRK